MCQVLSAWDNRLSETRSWANKRSMRHLSEGVVQRVKWRLRTHYTTAYAAAQLVDPLYLEEAGAWLQ